MNQVRAAGAQVRRRDKAAARARRGLPARRRGPAPFPSGQLRDTWPSVGLRRSARPVAVRLLGTGRPQPTLSQRSRIPVGLRDLHPVAFPDSLLVHVPRSKVEPVAVEPASTEPVAVEPVAVEPAATAPVAVEPVTVVPDVLVPESEPVAVAVAVAVEPDVVVPEPEPEPVVVEPVAEPVAAQPEPVDPEPVVETVPAPVVVEKPIALEKRVVVEKPVVVEKQVAPPPVPPVVVAKPVVVAPPVAVAKPVVVDGTRPPHGERHIPHEFAADSNPIERSARVLETTRAIMLGAPAGAAAGSAGTTVPSDTVLTESWDEPEPPRRRPSGRVLAVVAAVVVLAGVATAAGIVATRSDDPARPAATSTSATADTVAPLASWVRANVGTTATLYATDAAVASRVTDAGLAAQTVAGLAAVPAAGLVVTRVSGSAATSAQPLPISDSRCLVPLASFTAGDGAYVVGQTVARSVAQVEADREASTSTAQAATTGLLSNAALTVGEQARPIFSGGTLDLRAAALLAAIAQSQPVEVVAATQDDAERALGVPVRTLVVVVDDRAGLDSDVENARYPYAPVVSEPTGTDLPAGSVQLTWPVLADPALTVN